MMAPSLAVRSAAIFVVSWKTKRFNLVRTCRGRQRRVLAARLRDADADQHAIDHGFMVLACRHERSRRVCFCAHRHRHRRVSPPCRSLPTLLTLLTLLTKQNKGSYLANISISTLRCLFGNGGTGMSTWHLGMPSFLHQSEQHRTCDTPRVVRENIIPI